MHNGKKYEIFLEMQQNCGMIFFCEDLSNVVLNPWEAFL
jgi:hypothetical protein